MQGLTVYFCLLYMYIIAAESLWLIDQKLHYNFWTSEQRKMTGPGRVGSGPEKVTRVHLWERIPSSEKSGGRRPHDPTLLQP